MPIRHQSHSFIHLYSFDSQKRDTRREMCKFKLIDDCKIIYKLIESHLNELSSFAHSIRRIQSPHIHNCGQH